MNEHRNALRVSAAVAGLLAGAAALACGGNKTDTQSPGGGPASSSAAPASSGGGQMSCGAHPDGGSCHSHDPAKK